MLYSSLLNQQKQRTKQAGKEANDESLLASEMGKDGKRMEKETVCYVRTKLINMDLPWFEHFHPQSREILNIICQPNYNQVVIPGRLQLL